MSTTDWIAKIAAAPAGSLTMDEFFLEFKRAIAEHYGIDCEHDPMRPIPISNLSEEQTDLICNDDVFIPEDIVEKKDDLKELTANDFALCTDRLQQHLEEWIIQNIPRILNPKLITITKDAELIGAIEEATAHTINDYIKLGIIKNHKAPSLEEVHELLEKSWDKTVKLCSVSALPPANPRSPT